MILYPMRVHVGVEWRECCHSFQPVLKNEILESSVGVVHLGLVLGANLGGLSSLGSYQRSPSHQYVCPRRRVSTSPSPYGMEGQDVGMTVSEGFYSFFEERG